MLSYPSKIEQQMQRYYQSLCEKNRRRYAGIEAVKLGYGGISYISRLLGCNYRTIALGISELDDNEAMSRQTIRGSGGGRKSALATIEGLEAAFVRVIEQYTAGSPCQEKVKWTNLTRLEIANLLKTQGIQVSVTVIDQLLERHNFRQRKALKKLATGECEQRNEQFEKIAQLKEQYQAMGNPVMSMDTKKRK